MDVLHVYPQVKKVLSTNSEIPVSMGSLHDDMDFTTMVSRASFEESSKALLKRVTAPIDAALEQAGMTLNDIQEVEIIGGGGRIPKVSRCNEVLEALSSIAELHILFITSPFRILQAKIAIWEFRRCSRDVR